ncbi:AAA family ATPase [Parashewanella curva]|uniref:AAA family ATPase n=1 Tax=Parashewanella curva TaxID=2338552 RepID=UPI0014043F76|nr:AAA family ATPase [Parashewanella curva]
METKEELLAPILTFSSLNRFSLSQFPHVNSELLKDYLSEAINQGLTGQNILLYGDAGTGKTELARTLAFELQRKLLEVQSQQVEFGRLTESISSRNSNSLRLGYLIGQTGQK